MQTTNSRGFRGVQIWDIAKKRIRNTFEGHQQEIYSLDFSKDGRLIVSGSGDKTAKIWDMTEPGLYKTRKSWDTLA